MTERGDHVCAAPIRRSGNGKGFLWRAFHTVVDLPSRKPLSAAAFLLRSGPSARRARTTKSGNSGREVGGIDTDPDGRPQPFTHKRS